MMKQFSVKFIWNDTIHKLCSCSIGLTFMLASATSSSLLKGMVITGLALSLCTVKGIYLQHKHNYACAEALILLHDYTNMH